MQALLIPLSDETINTYREVRNDLLIAYTALEKGDPSADFIITDSKLYLYELLHVANDPQIIEVDDLPALTLAPEQPALRTNFEQFTVDMVAVGLQPFGTTWAWAG